jgi:hypothetical protein
MEKAYNLVKIMKEKKNDGSAVYNFKSEKTDLLFTFNQEYPCSENVLVNTKHLERTFKYLKKMLKNQCSEEKMNDFVINEMKPHDLRHTWGVQRMKGTSLEANNHSLNKLYNEKIWEELMCYSNADFPITDFSALPPAIRPSAKEVAIQNMHTDIYSNWERPRLLLIYRIMKYHKQLKELLPQYSTDGTRNVWIVKPCYNARGFGIYCIDNCFQEFHTFQKSQQSQSKIVQKYIEKPLLLNHHNEIRKFDIRQWVLVTSFEPLQIYMFSDFYLRICGSKYELSDIQDSYKHLTNFSI